MQTGSESLAETTARAFGISGQESRHLMTGPVDAFNAKLRFALGTGQNEKRRQAGTRRRDVARTDVNQAFAPVLAFGGCDGQAKSSCPASR